MSKRWLAQQERGHRWAYQCILWVALRLGRKTARALLYPICISLCIVFLESEQRH